MKQLCLICGRGGSKRLPGKNLLPLAGRPLIAHSIEQAVATQLFETIAVSSDEDKILKTAAEYGANLLIKRPLELATDEAGSLPVIAHAVKYAEKKLGIEYDSITYLQITSPLRLPADIIKAVEMFEAHKASNLVSVTLSKSSPYYTILELKNGEVAISKNSDKLIQKRPEFPQTYDMNGSIYIWNKDKFMAQPQHLYDDTKLLIMPALRSIDIDYQADFDIAEAVLAKEEYLKGEAYLAN